MPNAQNGGDRPPWLWSVWALREDRHREGIRVGVRAAEMSLGPEDPVGFERDDFDPP
jgi:hypothetical protein